MFTIEQFKLQLEENGVAYKLNHVHSWTLDDPNPVFGANVTLYCVDSELLGEFNTVEVMLRGIEVLAVSVRFDDAHIVMSNEEFSDGVGEYCDHTTIHPILGTAIPQNHWIAGCGIIDFDFLIDDCVIPALRGTTHRYSEGKAEDTREPADSEYMVEAVVQFRVSSDAVGIDGDLFEEVYEEIETAFENLDSITIKHINKVEAE